MASTAVAPVAAPPRTPRGYLPTVTLSAFGIYLAIFAPTVGGLSVRIQHLVGLDRAPLELGIVSGVSSAVALVVQPLAGRLSDRTMSRWGMRRPWLLVGILGMVVFIVGAGIAPNIPLIIVSMSLASFFSNLAFAAQSATLADQVPEEKRGGASGLLGAATPLGILVASILLSILPTDLLRFGVPALIGLVLGLIFTFVLRDKVRSARPEESLSARQILLSFVFNPRRHPDFGWAWLSKMFVLIGYGAVTGYLTLYLGTAFGMNTTQQLAFNATANIIAIGALMIVSVIGGFVSDRLGRKKAFVLIGGLMIALGVVIVALAPFVGRAGGLGLILCGEAVIGIGAGLFFAVDQALCIAALPNKDDIAKDLGVLNFANTLPSTLSPFLAGVVVIPLGNLLFPGGGYTVWFIVSAAFAVAGAIAVLRIRSVR
ncbi:MFS transporter [Gryllotalpicola reticulitermitis]|uniref:MFS transporter n=1 Tax=Gryllotalpicola reticulitermitis TaxID=1184153 RepID=A0ABV8Q3H9_9MICO